MNYSYENKYYNNTFPLKIKWQIKHAYMFINEDIVTIT